MQHNYPKHEPRSMFLPGIIDTGRLPGIFSIGSRCLYSFSNKQTGLEMHMPPITLTDRSTGTNDPRFYQWMWAASARRHRSTSSRALSSLLVSLGTAQHDMSTGCSTLKSGQSLLCHMLCISILGSLLTQSKALNSHSLSLTESNKGPCQALDNFLEKECC